MEALGDWSGSLLVVVASAIATAIGTYVVGLAGGLLGVVAIPNPRSLHVVPVPRTGGIAVVGGILVGASVGLRSGVTVEYARPGLLVGALVIFTVGVLDDVYGLKPSLRLVAQSLASVIAVWSASGSIWAFALSVFVIVAAVNAFNFMDGIDGLAAGKAVVVGLGLAWMFASVEAFRLVFLAVAGAALGFTPFNISNKRKVFLGDSGSTTLGFVLASQFILGPTEHTWAGLLSGVLVAGLFGIDTAVTILFRIRDGEHLGQAHRSHLYQLLVWRVGWTHGRVRTLYLSIDAALIVIAVSDFARIVNVVAIFAILLAYLALRHRVLSTRCALDSLAASRHS